MDIQEEISIDRPEQTGSLTPKMARVREILRQYAGFEESDLKDFAEAVSDPRTNRVLGAIFGAMIGDALGAYCEFLNQIPAHIEAQVMQMPGGGTFGTILPGQYTDDNELAYHLLKGLLQFNQENELQPQKPKLIKHIALEYIRWVTNNPFDIGNTCSSAIGYLTNCKEDIEQSDLDPRLMEDILKEITGFNSDSQANGSLMRIVPMAAFMSLLKLDPMKEQQFIKDQIKLTHPNKHLQIAGLCWVRLLSLLINRESNDKETLESILNSVQSDPSFGLLREWFTEAHQPFRDSMPGNKKMGWAKIAFSYGLKFLVYLCEGKLALTEKDLYKNWIKRVIMLAGDTDTNACIAGGLIGSIIGFQQLPIEYLEKIFKVQYIGKQTYTLMPREYEPSNFLKNVLTLINKSKAHHNRQNPNPNPPESQ